MTATAHQSYVAGTWVTGDDAFAVEDPSDESTFAEVIATPLGEVRRAVAEARRSFDSGRMGEPAGCRSGAGPPHVPRPPRTPAGARRPGRGDGGGGGPAPLLRGAGPAGRRPRPGPSDDRPVPVDATRGAERSTRRRAGAGRRVPQHPAPRAHRRGVGDHPVQRRDHHGLPEGHPRVDGGQLGHPAAEPAHPGVVARLRSRRRRRRAAGRRAERRRGAGGRGRRDPDQRPCSRHGVVHRLDRRRPIDPGPGRADGEARGPRARWQVGPDLPARRARAGRSRGDDGRGDDIGPGVRGRDPHARARGIEGRRARRGQLGVRIDQGRSSQRSDRAHGSGDHRGPARALRAVRRPGRGERGQGRVRRRVDPKGSTRATTSSPRSSISRTTPTRPPRRRSSVPS